MKDIIDLMSDNQHHATDNTVGWIKFLSPAAENSAKEGKMWLQPLDTWARTNNQYKKFSDKVDFLNFVKALPKNEYTIDVFEGRFVNERLPSKTEFASCFTIIQNSDIDPTTKQLNSTVYEKIQKYPWANGRKVLVIANTENLSIFVHKAAADFVNLRNCLDTIGFYSSPLFCRPIIYFGPSDYYDMGKQIEETCFPNNGLPVIADYSQPSEEERIMGYFGVFAKIDHYKPQNEARIGVSLNAKTNSSLDHVEISIPQNTYQICNMDELKNLCFK
ncbi:hypothetical protein LIQ96_05990 [Lacticaseibacillus paracasei]|jgi:hypothetical protein|uniref:hypothetical protein n=1 Tax=Lacticaseibacillus paracasei TaxID=1597 RepID=UPI000F0BB017|nr:hypothetical protein [Lacticaseibacillus paracasei]MCB5814901.1 hypothetical protein [Lacticaseibacillus paracasei]RND93198.1 hypothetical protein FAM19353_02236 [Lacticaseibacillus paracasei]RNE14532.1 hypothetical protein FAM3228_02281 [Lacticaseibacillus paracasei]